MPQLPSGRHIAIDPSPFLELMKSASHFSNIHKVMAIASVPNLLPWLDLMYLVEPGTANMNLQKYELTDSSFTPPPGLLALNANCRLSRWEALAKDWPPEDCAAMKSFLASERCNQYLTKLVYIAQLQQELFLVGDDFLPKLLAGWYANGIHPAQEESWSEGDDSPWWDTYDMLAAVGHVVQFVSTKNELYQLHPHIFDRATGVWQMLLSHYPFLREPAAIQADIRAIAKSWRESESLKVLSDDKQEWIHQQLMIECSNLWNQADDVLKEYCTNAFDIFSLVTLSPEANSIKRL